MQQSSSFRSTSTSTAFRQHYQHHLDKWGLEMHRISSPGEFFFLFFYINSLINFIFRLNYKYNTRMASLNVDIDTNKE